MLTIEEYRNRVAAQKQTQSVSKDDSPHFPFWKLEPGQTATIRFAPDADNANGLYWVEKHTINLPFAGVVGRPEAGKVTVAVPSLTTWGMKDRIIEETKPLWETNKDLARLFYFKRNYIFHGFVVSSDIIEPNQKPDNLRVFTLSPSLFKKVDAANMDIDLEHFVCDLDHGRDFRIKKTLQGQFANYDMSNFASKERKLSDEQRAVIAAAPALSTYVGEMPDAARIETIFAMYESSRRSEDFDPERFKGFYYKSSDTKLPEDFE